MQTPGRVENQHVKTAFFRDIQRPSGNRQRLFAVNDRQGMSADLPRQLFQLLLRRRTVNVERSQQHFAVFAEHLCQLGRTGGFARPLQTGHQDHCRRHHI